METVHRAFMLSPGTPVSKQSLSLPTWKLSEPPSLGIFMEALSHRHEQLLTQFPALLLSLKDKG